MKMKKGIKIGIIAIICLVIALVALFVAKKFMKKTPEGTAIYQVQVETYENVIEISGTVDAANEQKLMAKSSGTVVGVYVKAGDEVKEGDILVQLDDSQEKYDLAKMDYDLDVARITASAKELSLKKTQRLSYVQKIEDRKIVATFDGVLAAFNVAVGDSVEAKDTIGNLVNVDYLTAEVEVSETDVAKLKVGQQVNLTFSSYKDTVIGYVESWPKIGEVTSRGATVVKVKIRIDDYPEEILPNFSFTGKIQIEAPKDNIIVDRLAVGFDDNKQAYVVLAKTGEKISVKAVPYSADYMKIIQGDLTGGEMLVQQQKASKSGQKKKGSVSFTPPAGAGSGGNGSRGGSGRMGGSMPMGMPPF